eukprot:1906068-Prymnesium_polylepis.1
MAFAGTLQEKLEATLAPLPPPEAVSDEFEYAETLEAAEASAPESEWDWEPAAGPAAVAFEPPPAPAPVVSDPGKVETLFIEGLRMVQAREQTQ